MRVRTLILALAAILPVAVAPTAMAQVWGSYAWVLNSSGWVYADNGYHPMPGCLGFFPTPTENSFSQPGMLSNYLGSQFAMWERRNESEGTGMNSCEVRPTYVDAYASAWATIDGLNTSRVTLTYGINPVVYANPDASYRAVGSDTLDFTVMLDITGAPNGFPVQIYISWDQFGGVSGPYGSENAPLFNEDSCYTTAQLFVNGVEEFNGRFDFADIPPGPPASGWNRLQNQTSVINTFVGQSQMTIQAVLIGYAEVNSLFPMTPGPFPTRLPDENSCNQNGFISLSINVPNPLTEPDSLYSSALDFSVDIGGDAELSDPVPTGNEVFDPADIYQWHTPPLPVGGDDGVINDEILYGLDPFPNPPDGPPPATGVPVGSGNFAPDSYMDIDGHDMLDFHLNSFAYGPGNNPIGFFLAACVHPVDNLFISYDDDDPPNWSNPFATPTNSRSPLRGDIFGQAPPRRDEIVGLMLQNFGYLSPVAIEYPFQSEFELHPSLVPDPDYSLEAADDDVDALDIRDGQCNVWYFSVDHEASFGLDPGAVYMKLGGGPGGGFMNVVDPMMHLGLPFGVDLDALEFVWVYSLALNGNGLALLFSVDVDDPMTPPDESGGLQPNTLYFSFLNGISEELLGTQMGENIDAVTAWRTPLYTGYVNPQPCLGPSDLVIINEAGTGTISLNFLAQQTGTHNIWMTQNPNQAGNPPALGWLNIGSVIVSAGQNANFSYVPGPAQVYARYVVTKNCP